MNRCQRYHDVGAAPGSSQPDWDNGCPFGAYCRSRYDVALMRVGSQRAQGSVAANAHPLDPQTASSGRPSCWLDWLFVVLAVVSLLLLVVEGLLSDVPGLDRRYVRALVWADWGICAVFWVEFLIRLRRANNPRAFVASRWYDIIGMIPVSHPALRGFRMLRLVRIVVLTSRFVRLTNRSFGAMTFEALVRRYADVLLEVVSDAIIVRNLELLKPALARARFAERIAEALDQHRDTVSALMRQELERLPGSRVMYVPGVKSLLGLWERTATDAIIHALRSEELNQIVQQATTEVIDKLKVEIAALDAPLGPTQSVRNDGV